MISAVIITWRADALVHACVDSILQQEEVPEEILVVVSNTPRDLHLPPSVKVLQLGKNLGFTRAANAGAEKAVGDLLLLNDDTVLLPGCIKALRRNRSEKKVLQPKLLLPDGRVDNVGHGFFPDGFVWARGRNGPDSALSGKPGGFSGAAVFFPEGLWQQLGGFDERFDSFGEDVDLSLRLMRRNIPVVPIEEAVVIHQLGASYGRTDSSKIRRIERNRIRAAVRSLPISALAALPMLTLGRYALLGGLSVAGRGPGANVSAGGRKAALFGLWDGLKDVPDYWESRRKERQFLGEGRGGNVEGALGGTRSMGGFVEGGIGAGPRRRNAWDRSRYQSPFPAEPP